MKPATFLTCNDLTFAYQPGKNVIDGISFSLNRSDTLAIVGASGCGKSTLLRILSGILPSGNHDCLGGKVIVDGLTADQYRQTDKLAFMFQEPTLMPHLTVRENVSLPLIMKGLKGGSEKIEALIQAVGLQEAVGFLPKQLSGGMKTRVSLARSFTTNPELLLLDEPFSALDIVWKSKLYVELERLRELYKTTIMIVTHDVQEALLLSDHIIVLNSQGTLELMIKVNSEYSISERVKDISGYMNSIYTTHMLPIQDAIINGQTKHHEKKDPIHNT